MEEEKPRPLTKQECGSRAGSETLARHGVEHFKKIGAMGGTTTKAVHGHEHFVKSGAMGAAIRARRALAKKMEAERLAEEQGE